MTLDHFRLPKRAWKLPEGPIPRMDFETQPVPFQGSGRLAQGKLHPIQLIGGGIARHDGEYKHWQPDPRGVGPPLAHSSDMGPNGPFNDKNKKGIIGGGHQQNGGSMLSDLWEGAKKVISVPIQVMNKLGIKPSDVAAAAAKLDVPYADTASNVLKQIGSGFWGDVWDGFKSTISIPIKVAGELGIKPSDIADYADKVGVPLAGDAKSILKSVGQGGGRSLLSTAGHMPSKSDFERTFKEKTVPFVMKTILGAGNEMQPSDFQPIRYSAPKYVDSQIPMNASLLKPDLLRGNGVAPPSRKIILY